MDYGTVAIVIIFIVLLAAIVCNHFHIRLPKLHHKESKRFSRFGDMD